jgi:hypothetical protein
MKAIWTASGILIAMTFSLHAQAATKLDFAGNYSVQPPRYDSPDNTDRPADQKYGTPEDAARPGEKFFFTAVRALREKDYAFTVNMYEVSASWGYKPAQYNLGVMYLKGEGVPVDRARAMAWIALASERGEPTYVQARELLYADLSKDEFARANEIWRELKGTYADDIALARAKARWAQARAEMTGSRVGAAGPLTVGSASSGGRSSALRSPLEPAGRGGNAGKSIINGFSTAAFGVLGGGSEDGSKAYRQLRETDNPYDPRFEWRLSPTPTGQATVGPLIPAGDATSDDHPQNR